MKERPSPRSIKAAVRGLLLAASLPALAPACAAARQVTASADDYQSYRRTRLAPTLEARLSRSFSYLRQQPNGRWQLEVKTWFIANEASYFERSRDSLVKLKAYLAALPGGPHAQAAAERIAELELAERHAARREQELTASASEAQEKLDAAQAMRRELVRQVIGWVERLATIRSWGRPTSELDHEFIYEWRLREPEARCEADRCVKSLSLPYAVPEARRLGARRAVFDVTLSLEHGGVARASLTGPELWNRLAEAAEVRPIASDPRARSEALLRARQLVESAVERWLPAARCDRPAAEPLLLVRECDSLRLSMRAAVNPEEEDRIEVEPLPAAARGAMARIAADGGLSDAAVR